MSTPKGYRSISKRNYLYVASMLLVFAILCNVFYIPCYLFVRGLQRDQILTQHRNGMNKSMQLLDSSIQTIANVTTVFGEEVSELTVAASRDQISNLWLRKFQNKLYSYFMSTKYITEIGMTRGNDLLFSRNQIYFDKPLLTYEHYLTCDRPDWLEEFSGASCILMPAQFTSSRYGQYEALTVGYRVSTMRDMYLFAHYPLNELYTLFTPHEDAAACSVAIFQGQTLLASSGPQPSEKFETLSVSAESGLDLRIEVYLPHSYIEKDLGTMKHLMVVFLFVVLLTSILWVLVFSFAMSKPLRKVIRALFSTGHVQEDPGVQNSIDFLVRSVHLLGSKITDARQMLENQQNLSRIHILEQAINRGIFTEEAKRTFQTTFPTFPLQWRCAMIHYSATSETADIETLRTAVVHFLEEHMPEAIHIPSERGSLAILSCDSLIDPRSLLEYLRNFFEEHLHVNIRYTLGQVYDDPVKLVDAVQQLEHVSISRPKVASGQKPLALSTQRLHTLYIALQSGNEAAALEILESCKSAVLADKDPTVAKYAYRAIVYALLQLKSEDSRVSDIQIPTFHVSKIQQLFCEEFPACIRQFTGALVSVGESPQNNPEQALMQFIDDNLSSQQLSVTMVTDHFHISAPTLQKRMNAATGMTFSAYVENRRMFKARQALLSSGRSIQEIAESIGYSNTNSFYKAYRRYWGESPRDTRRCQDI